MLLVTEISHIVISSEDQFIWLRFLAYVLIQSQNLFQEKLKFCVEAVSVLYDFSYTLQYLPTYM